MVLWLVPEVFYELDLYLACWLSFCVFGLNLLWLVRGGAVGTLSMNNDVVIFYFLFVSVFSSLCCGLSFRFRTLDLVSDIGFGLMLCVARGRRGSVARCSRDEIVFSPLSHQTSR